MEVASGIVEDDYRPDNSADQHLSTQEEDRHVTGLPFVDRQLRFSHRATILARQSAYLGTTDAQYSFS
jgi:hypothetical protein